MIHANLDAVATPDINPQPVDLLWPSGIDLQLIADSAIPDDNGVFTFYSVAPTEPGTYFIRAACTFSESWGDDVVLTFSDGTAYSWYTYTPPELMYRIEVVPPTPPLGILPECL